MICKRTNLLNFYFIILIIFREQLVKGIISDNQHALDVLQRKAWTYLLERLLDIF